MASNGMNGTKAFQDTIAQYLVKRAENDPLVAVKLANPSKTMEQCCAYIIGEVKTSGCCGFADDEIFGMAMHYWEEPEIEVSNTPANYRVVVNHFVELSDEEKAQARKEAIAKLRDEEMAKMRKAKTTESSRSACYSKNKVKEVQPSLFDF